MFTAVAILRFLRRPRSGPLILMHTRRGRPAVRRDPLLRDRGGTLSQQSDGASTHPFGTCAEGHYLASTRSSARRAAR